MSVARFLGAWMALAVLAAVVWGRAMQVVCPPEAGEVTRNPYGGDGQ